MGIGNHFTISNSIKVTQKKTPKSTGYYRKQLRLSCTHFLLDRSCSSPTARSLDRGKIIAVMAAAEDTNDGVAFFSFMRTSLRMARVCFKEIAFLFPGTWRTHHWVTAISCIGGWAELDFRSERNHTDQRRRRTTRSKQRCTHGTKLVLKFALRWYRVSRFKGDNSLIGVT